MAGDPAPVDLPVRAVLLRGLYRVLVPVSHGRRVLRHATAIPAARGAGRARGGAHASERGLVGAPVVVGGDAGDGAAGGGGGARPPPRRGPPPPPGGALRLLFSAAGGLRREGGRRTPRGG